MRLVRLAVAAGLIATATPAYSQVVDTAGMIQRIRQELQAGRMTPEEVLERVRAAGISDQQIRRQLTEMGYPEELIERFLRGEVGPTRGPAAFSPAQLEQVLRRLSSPPGGRRPPQTDSLLLALDSLALDTLGVGGRQFGLPIFGRSLFRRDGMQFRPLTMGPVPSNYQLGPGDELVLILTGDVQAVYELAVTREGFIVIPEVGRVPVTGLTMEQLRNALYTYLGRAYSGVERGPEATTHFEVSLAELRTNQVFVIGEVEQPSSYELSSVSTTLHALYRAGGPTEQGSFRNIQIRRGDRLVGVLDVYEYLTSGVATGDIPLEQGDVVFVPVRGRRVQMDGNVVRPGIFEIKDGEGLRKLLELAGGIEPEADLRRVQIDRILPPEQRRPGMMRTLFDVNVAALADEEGEVVPLEAGDRVYVFAVTEERRNTVSIRGNVWQPGIYELVPEMRLSDLIDRAGGVKEDTYTGRAQVIRIDPDDLSRRIVAASLTGGEDPELREYDEVVIYSVADFRARRYVTIYGAVGSPGVYEYSDDMTLRDLIMMAGGLEDAAYLLEAEVASLVQRPDTTGDLTEIHTVPLDSSYVISEWAARGSDGGDGQLEVPEFTLSRYDNVFIRRRPGWETQRTVTLTGEVRFPGKYALQRKDERLASVIERAGGLTNEAYAAGIRFYRAQEEAPGGDGTSDSVAVLSRVNVDLPRALEEPRSNSNLILQSQDSIHVPQYIPLVRVEGAVLFPVNVLYERGAGLEYYIESAGGYARDGDKGRTRVEYANGAVRTVDKFLFFKSAPRPGPGSRVVVPVKPEGRPINWAAITGVVTAAATVYALLSR